jgi:hypothetical protein
LEAAHLRNLKRKRSSSTKEAKGSNSGKRAKNVSTRTKSNNDNDERNSPPTDGRKDVSNAVSRFVEESLKVGFPVVDSVSEPKDSAKEIDLRDVLNLISSESFLNAEILPERPSVVSSFFSSSQDDEDGPAHLQRSRISEKLRNMIEISKSIRSIVEHPETTRKLDYEKVVEHVPSEVWCTIGEFVAASSPNLKAFLDVLVILGKVVRAHILKGMLKDPRLFRTWACRNNFPKAANLFVFSDSIWQPVCVKEPKALIDGNHYNRYLFPPFLGKADNKGDVKGANFEKINAGLLSVTRDARFALRSVSMNFSLFREMTVTLGKECLEKTGFVACETTLEAWGFEKIPAGEELDEAVGQRLYLNRPISQQAIDYERYSRAKVSENPEDPVPGQITHRAYFVDDRLENSALDSTKAIEEDEKHMFAIKVKKPNTSAELGAFSFRTGAGVQIKGAKQVTELFPYVW